MRQQRLYRLEKPVRFHRKGTLPVFIRRIGKRILLDQRPGGPHQGMDASMFGKDVSDQARDCSLIGYIGFMTGGFGVYRPGDGSCIALGALLNQGQISTIARQYFGNLAADSAARTDHQSTTMFENCVI